jgi:hypothetical protein
VQVYARSLCVYDDLRSRGVSGQQVIEWAACGRPVPSTAGHPKRHSTSIHSRSRLTFARGRAGCSEIITFLFVDELVELRVYLLIEKVVPMNEIFVDLRDGSLAMRDLTS